MSLPLNLPRTSNAGTPSLRRAFHAFLAGLFGSALLTGCSANMTPTAATVVPAEAGSLHGAVHGGQQIVSGAHIYLFAAGTAGFGSPSTSLLSASQPGVSTDTTGTFVTSAADGSFSITGDYVCTPGTQLYALVQQGNPGLAAGTNNAALALMAALGTCPSGGNLASTLPSISINEVTTVASVYALRGFMADSTHIASGSSAAATLGLANAFATVANLVDLTSGSALTSTPTVNGANGTVPTARINTLANLLAACVDTDGTVPACTQLVSSAKAGASTPSDTVTALFNIASAPAANLATLYAVGTYPNPPFQPALTAQPADLTLSIAFQGGAINNSRTPAVDASGNVWVPNQTGGSVTEISPLGVFLSGANGDLLEPSRSPQQIAFDANGDAIMADFGFGGVSVLSSAGTLITSFSGFNDNGFNSNDSATAVAVDASNNVWLVDAVTNLLGEFSPTGAAIAPNAFGSGLMTQPQAIAIDSSGNVLVADAGTSRLIRFSSTGALAPFSATSSALLSGSGLSQPTALALDHNDNLWVANANSSLSAFDKNGNPLSTSGFTGGGLNVPLSIAVDGAGHLWLPNASGNSISHFDNSGNPLSPATGFPVSGQALGLALDPSGNVWVTSNNTSGSSVIEFIGTATPVATPIAQGHAGIRP